MEMACLYMWVHECVFTVCLCVHTEDCRHASVGTWTTNPVRNKGLVCSLTVVVTTDPDGAKAAERTQLVILYYKSMLHTHTHTDEHTHTHAHTPEHTHTCIHNPEHTNAHTHAHAHTHTHTQRVD